MLIVLFGIYFHILEIPILIFLLAHFFIKIYQKGFYLEITHVKYFLLIFIFFSGYLLAIICSSFFAYNVMLVIKSFFKWSEVILLAILVFYYIENSNRFTIIYWLLFAITFSFVLEIYYKVLRGELDFFTLRIFPGIESALALALLVPFLENKKWIRFISFLLIIISAILSLSRATWLALIIILLFTYSQGTRHIRKTIILTFCGLLLVYFFVPIVAEIFKYRWYTAFSPENTSNIERTALLNYAILAFKENPIFGVGSLNFPLYFINKGLMEGIFAENYFVLEPHNAIIQVAAEEGILGLLFFVAWLFSLGYYIFLVTKQKPNEKYFLGLKNFYIALFINIIFGYIASQYRFCLAIFWGLVISACQKYNVNNS